MKGRLFRQGLGSFCGVLTKAGRGVAAGVGVSGEYQLWVRKSGGRVAKGCAEGAISWVCIVGAQAGLLERVTVGPHVWKTVEAVACLEGV